MRTTLPASAVYPDRGVRKVYSPSYTDEDTDAEPQEDDLDLEEPVVEESAKECFPFCEKNDLEDPMDEVSDKAPADEISDKDCSEHSWPPCGYYWPWPS